MKTREIVLAAALAVIGMAVGALILLRAIDSQLSRPLTR